MWSDRLSVREAEYTQRAIVALGGVVWAKPLLRRLEDAGGFSSETMPLMFEARFAYEVHLAGLIAEYEYHAGVGDSTVEFRIGGTKEWLVELVRVRTSNAAERAIRKVGFIYEQTLGGIKDDPHETEEAEMITAEQKIGEKAFTGDRPTKFPVPAGAFHLILADMRGYLDEGGDVLDYLQMALGPSGLLPRDRWAVHYWKSTGGELEPIAGLFETRNPLRSAKYIRERVHFLGFVRERAFCDNEIRNGSFYCGNPHLFRGEAEAIEGFATFPLQPIRACAR